MPQLRSRPIPADDPESRYTGWPGGLNTYPPKNKIKKDQMSDCQNIEIFLNAVDKRFGTQYVGNSKGSRTRGLHVYTHSDGTKKIIRSSGTTLQEYNTGTGNYDDISGKTYTSDLNTDYIQAYDNLYIYNGTDNLTKYNKDDSPGITTYTLIGAPTSPSAARGAGLASGQYTAYFVLTHYNEIGETVATSEFSVAYDIPRSQWDGVTEKVDLSWTNDAGVTSTNEGTNIYFADTSGDWTFLDTVTGTGTSWSYLGGEINPDGITEPPETNQTAGPIAYKGDFDGTRQWCFSGSSLMYSGGGSRDIDHFDSGSGGGALNIAKGDGDEIQKVIRTRDGAVIVYKQFSIWKAGINASGLPYLQLINPLIGCVGHRAGTTVDDDQIFLSRYGVFTLGNQPNFPTDILRVRSISFSIDKDLEKITPSVLQYSVLHYDFKRRLRLSYAQGGSSYNNAEFMFKYGAWAKNTGISANCYVNMTDTLTGSAIIDELNKQYTLYGSDDEGRVIQMDKGYSDRGSNIDAYFDTIQDDQGFPERYKKYYEQDIEIGRLQGSLNVYQFFDSGTDVLAPIDFSNIGGIGSEQVGFSEVGNENGTIVANSSVSATKRWNLNGRQQKNVRTRFRQSSNNGTFSIMTFASKYRLMSKRKYDSEDIVTIQEV